MSTIPPAASNQQPSKGVWPTVAPYIIPPIAAFTAILPVFRDLAAKSALQKGEPIPAMTFAETMKGGAQAARTAGVIIGVQMVFQRIVEKALTGEANSGSLSSACISSAIVGVASSPALAVFNGQTMGWTVRESLRRFSLRQGAVIAVQETACVGGLTVADRLAVAMRGRFGNSRAIDYTAAFVAGAAGGLVGHPANTALTRWQSGMVIDSARQLMWGSLHRARALGIFSVTYKLGKEAISRCLDD